MIKDILLKQANRKQMIGKAIKDLTLSDTTIKARINNGANLYPISDYSKASGDSIFYIVRALPQTAKGTITMTKWLVTLITQCKTYSKSWELSWLLKKLYEKQAQQTHADIKFTNIKCTSITDDYEFVINGYGQQLQFEITTPEVIVEID